MGLVQPFPVFCEQMSRFTSETPQKNLKMFHVILVFTIATRCWQGGQPNLRKQTL